jgi:hypothetical protein
MMPYWLNRPPVAFHCDHQVAPVLEGQPGAAVGEQVRAHAGSGVQRRPHALPDLAIPASLVMSDVDRRGLPQLELGEMRAAAVPARYERRLGLMDALQSLHRILAAGDSRRVRFRADQHEIVVHDLMAAHAEAFGDELLLERLRVHEHHVGVSAPAHVERLAGAERDHAHLDPGLLLEDRQQVLEQARLLGGRGRRDRDVLLRIRAGRKKGEEQDQDAHQTHGNSPLMKAAASAVDG